MTISGNFREKNGHSSESVNSIDSGIIFRSSLGHDISRNALVVSIPFPERISSRRKDFSMTPKNRDFHDFSTFLGSCREASGMLLGHIGSVSEGLRVPVNDFMTPKIDREKSKKSRNFP